MLHIILGILTVLLTILKWLGLILLFLLILILAVLLLVLLVPVRYYGRCEKKEEKREAGLSAAWLRHLFFVQVSFGAEGLQMNLLIFGKTPEAWRALLKKRKKKRRKNPKKRSRVGHTEQLSEISADDQMSKSSEASLRERTSKSSEAPPRDQKSGVSEASSRRAEVSGKKKKNMFSSAWTRVCSFVSALPYKIKRICDLLHQPMVFLEFWKNYEIREVFEGVKKELFALLRHYRPRCLSGYLKFGTGDPALTGELTGVLYLLLPTREYELFPDFEEVILETETEFSGHIRSVHLLVAGYHLFRNQKLKRLIRKLRKKGE